MRKTTTAIVGAASVAAIWASWLGGRTLSQVAPGVSVVGAAAAHGAASRPGASTSSRTGAATRPSTGRPGAGKHAAAQPRPETVDGASVDTQYGTVQVSLTHVGATITDVRALRLTDSSQHSVSLSAYAAPILRQEALAAQSAQVDVVSGATYTSEAYQTSLQAAIDAAHL